MARALIHSPRLLVADEPTGNLDSETGGAHRRATLLRAERDDGCTIVIATHNEALAGLAHQRVGLRDGRLVEGPAASGQGPAKEHARPTPQPASEPSNPPLSLTPDPRPPLEARC